MTIKIQTFQHFPMTLIPNRRENNNFQHSLQSFVFYFPLLPSDWVFVAGVVAGVHNELTELPEATLPSHGKQWCVKVRVVLPQVFLPLVPEEFTVALIIFITHHSVQKKKQKEKKEK